MKELRKKKNIFGLLFILIESPFIRRKRKVQIKKPFNFA